MSSITDAHPILPCLNWEETIAFYDKLGFALGNLFPDQYLILHRDGIQLLSGSVTTGSWRNLQGATFAAWMPTHCMLNLPHAASNVRRLKIAHGEFGSYMLSIPMEICCA